MIKILELTDFSLQINLFEHPKQGQFVVVGKPNQKNNLDIGYCVQVRKKAGQFSSDLIFLRHSDGSLVVHENQRYYKMTEEQEKMARKIFKIKPEQEEYNLGYSCPNKLHEIGFIIENKKKNQNTFENLLKRKSLSF